MEYCRNLSKNIKKEINLYNELRKKTLFNVMSGTKTNVLKKCINTVFMILFLGGGILPTFALEIPSCEINENIIDKNNDYLNRNKEFNLLNDDCFKYDLKDNQGFQLYKLKNIECADNILEENTKYMSQTLENKNVPEKINKIYGTNYKFDFVESIDNPKFRQWCKLNMQLIRSKNLNKSKAYCRFYYATHKEQMSEVQRKYNDTHREQIKVQRKEYREKNRERILNLHRKYNEIRKEQRQQIQYQVRCDKTYLKDKEFKNREIFDDILKENNKNENISDKLIKKDEDDFKIEFIEKIRNPQFKQWCELNRELIKNENMDRERAYNRFYRLNNSKRIKEQCKMYYETHKEQIIEQNRDYKKNNESKVKLIRQKYNDAHKEEIKEKKRMYYESHKDEQRERSAIYYEENKNKMREYQKVYYESHKDEQRERNAIYYEANKNKLKEYQKVYRETHANKTQQINCQENYKDKVNACREELRQLRKEESNEAVKANLYKDKVPLIWKDSWNDKIKFLHLENEGF